MLEGPWPGTPLNEPIVIWGAGAIGGTLGAYWAQSRRRMSSSSTRHASMSRPAARQGLRSKGRSTPSPRSCRPMRRRRLQALRPHRPRVKAHQTADALAALRPHLNEDGYVLSAQNGLNEITHRQTIGERADHGLLRQFRRRLDGTGPHSLWQSRRCRHWRDRRPSP